MRFWLLSINLSVLFCVKSDNDVTLTTATLRHTTSPKPTTLYHRILVEQFLDKTSSTPLDLLSLRDHAERRIYRVIGNSPYYWKHLIEHIKCNNLDRPNVWARWFSRYFNIKIFIRIPNFKSKWIVFERHSQIWDWDFWCQLQPKLGTCSNSLIKFYYDTQLDQCLSFTYSGCGGNKNNFDTLLDCERHCKGASYMSIRDHDEPLVCSLQNHAGMCLVFINRYYYDVNDRTCHTFMYGGCGGNQNNFETKTKCMRVCGNTE